MKKTFLILSALLCLAKTAPAQRVSLNAASTACGTTNSCLVIPIAASTGGATFTLSGTFVGTVQFEASADYGSTYVAFNVTPSNSTTAASSATAGGVWQGNAAGYTNLRIRISAYTSGTVVASIATSTASARAGGGGGGGSVTLNGLLDPTADKTFDMGAHNLILSAPKFFSVGVLPSVPDNYLTGPLIVTGPGPNNEYGEITLWYPEHGRASVQLESAGGPLSAPTASGLGDYIGNVEWLGAGTDTFPDTGDLAAQIVGIVDKNPGPGVVRARLEFHTSDGTGMSVERARINSDGDTYLGLNSGNVGVGVATGSVPAASLEVSGGVLSTSIAVASLPAAAAGNKGQIRTVSDSTAVMTEGQTCAGMGSATALAFSDGANWKCF